MSHEIRSGRLIGIIFTIICVPISLFILNLSYRDQEPLLLVIVLLFSLGAAIGITQLVKPPILVRVINRNLELYPGTVWSNKLQISVPIDDIDSLQVKRIQIHENFTWFLTLNLNRPQSLSKSAKRWVKAHTNHSELANDGELTLHWLLSWPEDNVENVQQKLKMLIGK